MQIEFNILRKSRELVLKSVEKMTLNQIHNIPEGFKNNIAWNVAHLVVTQQLLHYKLSGLDCLVSDTLINNYRKGTAPTKVFTETEFDEIKKLLITLPNTLERDYQNNVFKNYREYPTSTGFVLTDIKTAISFNNLHEGIHLGAIMALSKLV